MRRDRHELTPEQVHALEVTRMLLWFKEQLPQHEVGEFRVRLHRWEETLVDDIGSSGMTARPGIGYLTVESACVKCGERFDSDGSHQWRVYADEEQERLAADFPTLTTDAVLAHVREKMQSTAEASSKCWAAVPKIPERSQYWAVAD